MKTRSILSILNKEFIGTRIAKQDSVSEEFWGKVISKIAWNSSTNSFLVYTNIKSSSNAFPIKMDEELKIEG